MNDVLNQVRDILVSYAPNLLGALAILVVGWLAALLMAAAVRGALQKLGVGRFLGRLVTGRDAQESVDVSPAISKVTFYVLMLLVLVAFFQALRLTLITEPLNDLLSQVFAYAPQVLGAAILIFLAWGTATVVRFLATRGIGALKLDRRLGRELDASGATSAGVSRTIGEVAYWMVFLLFLPGILGALELRGLLEPVQDMTHQLFAFVPNLFGAFVILLFGWLVAKVVQRIVVGLLGSAGADRLAERAELRSLLGTISLSGLAGYIAYFLILIPVLVSALNALALDSITRPANQMLTVTMGAFPYVFAALLLLLVSYVIGRLLSGITVNLLSRIGVNNLLSKLGFPNQRPQSEQAVAGVVGTVVFAAVMLFAAIEAFNLLGFTSLTALLAGFVAFLGQVALGLFVFAVGLIFANLASRLVRSSGSAHARILAPAARIAVIVLAASMALREMGLADEIVTLAFALLLGALAVAGAIAFGLGGRDTAAAQLAEWRASLKANRS